MFRLSEYSIHRAVSLTLSLAKDLKSLFRFLRPFSSEKQRDAAPFRFAVHYLRHHRTINGLRLCGWTQRVHPVHSLASFPSFCTNFAWKATAFLHSICTIWRKIWLRVCTTIIMRWSPNQNQNNRRAGFFPALRILRQEILLWQCGRDGSQKRLTRA